MSRAVLLTGTCEIEPAPTPLAAGPLTAQFDRGALRNIRWRGVEILRGLSFLARTPGWGTPAPEISDLTVESNGRRFSVAYDAVYRNGGQSLKAQISFVGLADGRLRAAVALAPQTDFTTNRSGFVVLHPLDGFAGTLVKVEHADGRVLSHEISDAISPGQPLFAIRAITHRPAEGFEVETRFHGDVFEMEDHRNWSDASFKTYSRPIGLPHPYDLRAGDPSEQTVEIAVREAQRVEPKPATSRDARVEIGAPIDAKAPALLVGLDAGTAAAGLAWADRLEGLGPFAFLYRHDPGQGDGDAALDALAGLARAAKRPFHAELILTGPNDANGEIGRFAVALAARDLIPKSVAAFPASDRQSFQPGETRPPAPAEADIAAALRKLFPGVRIVGGTPAFFTELNRKRPSPGLFDTISHATTPTVHASDDRSVMETLQSLPHIVRSGRRLASGAAYRIGPIGVGARLNPYGDGPTPNPEQIRIGLADADPRQRGLLGAAWHLGYAAAIAPLGVAELALGGPVGPFGLVSTPAANRRPLWDDLEPGAVYPLYHVAADLAEAAGRELLAATSSDPRIAMLAYLGAGGRVALIANLAPEPVRVTVTDFGPATLRLLDAATALTAAHAPATFQNGFGRIGPGATLTLDAYATAKLVEQDRT
jgi:hypothetical protein